MNYFTWTPASRSAALLQSRLFYKAWQHLPTDHTLPVLLLNGITTSFFSSLSFFFLFQNTLVFYIDKWRWKSVKTWIVSCFQSVINVGQGAVCLWSLGCFWTGLYLVWNSWELLWACGGYLQISNYSLSWIGDGELESCRRGCHRKRTSSPSFCSICILEISSLALMLLKETATYTHAAVKTI